MSEDRKEKFTPGPWFADNGTVYCVNDMGKRCYFVVTTEANAVLISASPEMYDMLKLICEMQEKNYGDGIETHIALISMTQKAREILKKARGENEI